MMVVFGVLQSLLLIFAGFYILKQRKFVIQQGAALLKSFQHYNALEQGIDEIQEGYEQEYLTWEETEMGLRNRITELTEERNELKEVVEKHDLNCLLDVEEMRIAALKAASLHE